MATYHGVRWDEWLDGLPYELVMACIDALDGGDGED